MELERASKQHQRQSTSDSELGEDDPNANKRICELEEQLARSEIRLNKHSASLGVLNETIQSLEINHCFLIRTRRKFEDEALNLSRFNGSCVIFIYIKIKNLWISFVLFHRALRQKDIHEVPTATLATSSSTETSSSDNTASPDDHSAANEDTLNGNTVQPTNTSDDIPTCCAMQSLRHSIAFEKAKLMRNVEVNSDKSVLDEGIDRLHALQRQYFALEKQIEYGSHQGDQVCSCHREHDESPCVDKSLTTSITTSRSNCNWLKYRQDECELIIIMCLCVFQQLAAVNMSSVYLGLRFVVRGVACITNTRSPLIWQQINGRSCDVTVAFAKCI